MPSRNALVTAGVMFGLVACGSDDGGQTKESPTIAVLSSHPSRVSGGDALVSVSIPGGSSTQTLQVALNGTDVTSKLQYDAATNSWKGVVNGMGSGANTLTASAPGLDSRSITVTNHSINGPIFSGPRQTPFFCETVAFGLPATADETCSAPSKITYFYRSSATNTFKPFDTAAARPTDLATTTTAEGNTVPYIVRQEHGTIDRAVYVVNILHDPSTPLPTPIGKTPAYNGRLVYSFGGGCMAGYHQGATVGGLTQATFNLEDGQVGYQDYFLAKGYAVIGGSLNVTGTTCADVISAESAAMIKEHFIELYGVPRYTIGAGGSGGSMQQHLIANNYPGLLDGIMPGRAYPDQVSFLNPLFDCELVVRAVSTSALPWSGVQATAVSGEQDIAYCVRNGARYPNLRPNNCNAAIPATSVFNALTNPTGARCTYQDNMVNVYGRNPATGFARRPFDNVGWQYGLVALNEGKISFDQFLDLNSRIGGHDIDGNIVPARSVGDAAAVRTLYETGRLNTFGLGNASVPIIDVRSYLDFVQPNGEVDVHNAYHSRVNRARLIAANGNADNQVIVTVQSTGTLAGDFQATAPLSRVSKQLFDSMDQWLAAIAADNGPGTKAQKVVRNKPSALVDACYDGSLNKITDAATCARMFPYYGDPRLAAGAPATDDVFKCALKPVDAADYKQTLTTVQLDQVRAIFPEGVCDFTKRPPEQVPIADTWLSYPSPGTFARTDH